MPGAVVERAGHEVSDSLDTALKEEMEKGLADIKAQSQSHLLLMLDRMVVRISLASLS